MEKKKVKKKKLKKAKAKKKKLQLKKNKSLNWKYCLKLKNYAFICRSR